MGVLTNAILLLIACSFIQVLSIPVTTISPSTTTTSYNETDNSTEVVLIEEQGGLDVLVFNLHDLFKREVTDNNDEEDSADDKPSNERRVKHDVSDWFPSIFYSETTSPKEHNDDTSIPTSTSKSATTSTNHLSEITSSPSEPTPINNKKTDHILIDGTTKSTVSQTPPASFKTKRSINNDKESTLYKDISHKTNTMLNKKINKRSPYELGALLNTPGSSGSTPYITTTELYPHPNHNVQYSQTTSSSESQKISKRSPYELGALLNTPGSSGSTPYITTTELYGNPKHSVQYSQTTPHVIPLNTFSSADSTSTSESHIYQFPPLSQHTNNNNNINHPLQTSEPTSVSFPNYNFGSRGNINQ